ncbi:hypothetical protein LTR10_002810 [Elasticomyces elasticus]|nr:hypothetical protein LTR10_002810 [Elasticomyces elasticus]KAK4967851.1 hypothetical protein LTR42_010178 [Elasticomyces elasticus]
MPEIISADYLVVGAGAMGMAFVDTLLANSSATIAIVDRYHRPGGHWTVAYPFVRLHQPSASYGVSSKHLGQDKIDEVGWNRGLLELASSDEILAYYGQVMEQTFLPSGRVSYFPKSEFDGESGWRSLVTGKSFHVGKSTRIVDAAYMKVTVPSMQPPAYKVDSDVQLVTPNDLTKVSRLYANYTVVGAGKTGIDAILWLLKMGIEAASITWIMPRDAWLLDRELLQPGRQLTPRQVTGIQRQGESIMTATSVDDLFEKLEARGSLMRISGQVWPTRYRCATVSRAELEQVRTIANVVRKGRVLQIGVDEIKLENGEYAPVPDTLYVDCSADGLAKHPSVPVFSGNRITLQSVRQCQQVFSGAFIAHVEEAYGDDINIKNEMCKTVPHPDEVSDWLRVNLQTNRNTIRWYAEPTTRAWLAHERLDMMKGLLPPMPEDADEQRAVLQGLGMQLSAMSDQLEKLLGGLPQQETDKTEANI